MFISQAPVITLIELSYTLQEKISKNIIHLEKSSLFWLFQKTPAPFSMLDFMVLTPTHSDIPVLGSDCIKYFVH